MKNLLARNTKWFLVAIVTLYGAGQLSVSAEELASTQQISISARNEAIHADISNFARVSDGIYRGANPSEHAVEQLAKGGVKTIIDLRLNGGGTDKESAKAQELGMHYVHIPMTFATPTSDQISTFLKLVTDPVNQPVYVHCRQGADRTGTLIAIYRRAIEGWTFSQAYTEMRSHHFKPFLVNLIALVKRTDKTQFATIGITSNLAVTPIAVTAQK